MKLWGGQNRATTSWNIKKKVKSLVTEEIAIYSNYLLIKFGTFTLT
jgi:hypothetical protein